MDGIDREIFGPESFFVFGILGVLGMGSFPERGGLRFFFWGGFPPSYPAGGGRVSGVGAWGMFWGCDGRFWLGWGGCGAAGWSAGVGGRVFWGLNMLWLWGRVVFFVVESRKCKKVLVRCLRYSFGVGGGRDGAFRDVTRE